MNYYYVDTYSRLRYPTHVFGIRISWKRDSSITHENFLFHLCSASFVLIVLNYPETHNLLCNVCSDETK